MLRYLVDTNICIDAIKRRPKSLLVRFNENTSYLTISAIILTELLYGAEKSSLPQRTLTAVENFCSRLDVLDYGGKAAQHYWQIRSALDVFSHQVIQ
jgi:tRNA(fMet)-specific endonuclease VapC